MKTILMVLMLYIVYPVFGDVVRVRIIDDRGAPLPGVETQIIFGQVGVAGSDTHVKLTDSAGIVTASGRATSSVRVMAERNGYYRSDLVDLPIGRDLNLSITLRQVVHPVPLFAKMVIARPTELTGANPRREKLVNDDVIGYDLEVGDAMPPLGRGRHCDVIFSIHAEFKGWHPTELEMRRLRGEPIHKGKTDAELRGHLAIGMWDASLIVSFPNENDGLIEVREEFLEYSGLKMPREAPTSGYVRTWRTNGNNFTMTEEHIPFGLFLRTRVKQDDQGRIISANYAKVPRGFIVDPRGGAMFTYYFNPTPNDRNLEFDVEKNLFPEPQPGSRVNWP